MSRSDTDLSRAVAHALRHRPAAYGLELDPQGWVEVDALLAALRRRARWASVDEASLGRMLAHATKRRFEMTDGRIRALYGHSVPGGVVKAPVVPPPVLFHGTTPEALAAIESEGLSPMGRQLVHLSLDRGTALSVGRRRSPQPVVLSVDAAAAARAGVRFYAGNDDVWLADAIPARFVRR